MSPGLLRPGFDLHLHSCYSDGLDSPGELLSAAERTLSLISICDHDTVAAYEQLPESTVEVLPGVEITARLDGLDSLHVLGYFPDGLTDSFRGRIGQLAEGRRSRVMAGVQSLRDRGVPLSQFALAWVMAQPGVTSPIIGPRTMEQLEDNLAAAEVALTEEDMDQVDQVIAPGQMVAPFYEADFGPHRFRV